VEWNGMKVWSEPQTGFHCGLECTVDWYQSGGEWTVDQSGQWTAPYTGVVCGEWIEVHQWTGVECGLVCELESGVDHCP